MISEKKLFFVPAAKIEERQCCCHMIIKETLKYLQMNDRFFPWTLIKNWKRCCKNIFLRILQTGFHVKISFVQICFRVFSLFTGLSQIMKKQGTASLQHFAHFYELIFVKINTISLKFWKIAVKNPVERMGHTLRLLRLV